LFYDQHSKTYQLFAKWDLDDPNNPLYTSGMREFPGKKEMTLELNTNRADVVETLRGKRNEVNGHDQTSTI
jgi:hypothetical protein